jgi:pimeloyl-ACP methyl ester carboxylesterase
MTVVSGSPLTQGFVNTAQCRFFYGEAGRGPAVLLLHSGGGTHHDWAHLFPHLVGRHRVIAPDLPGSGQSDPPREGYVRTTLGRSIVEFLKGLGEERVAVVAHGLGAFLAVEVAAATPYVVERLVLVSPTIGGIEGTERRLTVEEALAESRIYGTGNPPDSLEQIAGHFLRTDEGRRRFLELRREHCSADAAGIAEELRLAGNARDGILLSTFRCPTLVVRPEHDTTFSRARGQRVASIIPNGRFVAIADAGHFVHIERPEALARVVLPFLQER